jgi:hypothetical protein
MADRCFVCGVKEHRAAGCPHKRAAKAKVVGVGAEPSAVSDEGEATTKHAAAAVSAASLLADESEEGQHVYLFDSGASHVLLPAEWLPKRDKAEAAKIHIKVYDGHDVRGVEGQTWSGSRARSGNG